MTVPYFSIIIPVYNREKFIEKAISSVLQQTYTDWELIIIDDASTDSTPKILESYITYDKIKIIRNNRNEERSKSRNAGINLSKGKFICFLDSDDYFLENHLELMHKLISSNDESVAFYHSNGFINKNGLSTEKNVSINPQNPVESVILHNIPVNTTCIHRNILTKEQFDTRLNINEDIYLFARIIAQYPYYSHAIPTTVWVIHDENTKKTVENPYLPQLKSSNIIFNDPILKPYITKSLIKHRYHKIFISLVYYHVSSPIKSLYYFFFALYMLPKSKQNKPALGAILYRLPGGRFLKTIKRSINYHKI